MNFVGQVVKYGTVNYPITFIGDDTLMLEGEDGDFSVSKSEVTVVEDQVTVYGLRDLVTLADAVYIIVDEMKHKLDKEYFIDNLESNYDPYTVIETSHFYHNFDLDGLWVELDLTIKS